MRASQLMIIWVMLSTLCVVSALATKEKQDRCAKYNCDDAQSGLVCLEKPAVVFKSMCDFEHYNCIHNFVHVSRVLRNDGKQCSKLLRQMESEEGLFDKLPVGPKHKCLKPCPRDWSPVCDNFGGIHANKCKLKLAMCHNPNLTASSAWDIRPPDYQTCYKITEQALEP